jgi:hypothetical protein
MTHPDLLPALMKAQLTLHLNQQQLADLLGSSLRTVQRWYARRSTMYPQDVSRLAAAVHPVDPDLARRLAACIGQTPESLGIVPPAASPPPPSPPAAAALPQAAAGAPGVPSRLRPVLVEAVVAAAAEALDVSPRVARPAVLAAMERAKTADLAIDDLLAVLRPPAPPAAGKRAKA